MSKRVLISVFEKDNIVEFASELVKLGWKINEKNCERPAVLNGNKSRGWYKNRDKKVKSVTKVSEEEITSEL